LQVQLVPLHCGNDDDDSGEECCGDDDASPEPAAAAAADADPGTASVRPRSPGTIRRDYFFEASSEENADDDEHAGSATRSRDLSNDDASAAVAISPTRMIEENLDADLNALVAEIADVAGL
jgi:hypothetical protein